MEKRAYIDPDWTPPETKNEKSGEEARSEEDLAKLAEDMCKRLADAGALTNKHKKEDSAARSIDKYKKY